MQRNQATTDMTTRRHIHRLCNMHACSSHTPTAAALAAALGSPSCLQLSEACAFLPPKTAIHQLPSQLYDRQGPCDACWHTLPRHKIAQSLAGTVAGDNSPDLDALRNTADATALHPMWRPSHTVSARQAGTAMLPASCQMPLLASGKTGVTATLEGSCHPLQSPINCQLARVFRSLVLALVVALASTF